jgi:hypothetical protein
MPARAIAMGAINPMVFRRNDRATIKRIENSYLEPLSLGNELIILQNNARRNFKL